MNTANEFIEKVERNIEKYKGKHRLYAMTLTELRVMMDYAEENLFECISTVFNYGFVKGIRYQKAQEKKKKSKTQTNRKNKECSETL